MNSNLIGTLLDSQRVACRVHVNSKKGALDLLSERLAADIETLSQEQVFESLNGRERLGSTGFGKGVALPHGRVANLDRPVGVFLVLDEAIDYDAIDGQPVDLLFALVVPEAATEEHLQIFAALSGLFSDEHVCQRLRACETGNDAELLSLLTGDTASAA
ncbi:MAG: PTS sugar transporter subunit IIA [Gammaproteobacteria bacterium]|nr:PTS sugar transporter subunit IIA [Gammaproteobacteria bacterium]MCP5135454.1 PTS sugar transporter subunit IIA [Gammaproteobacteria bacterium]